MSASALQQGARHLRQQPLGNQSNRHILKRTNSVPLDRLEREECAVELLALGLAEPVDGRAVLVGKAPPGPLII